MAVQTAKRSVKRKDGQLKSLKMAGGAVYGKIWGGAAVIVQHGNTPNKEGYALGTADGSTNPCRNVASNLDVFAGVAVETVDNSAGSDGDKVVQVFKTGEFSFIGASLAITDVGLVAYLTDTQTIANAVGTGKTPCGIITEVVSATEARVRIDNYAK